MHTSLCFDIGQLGCSRDMPADAFPPVAVGCHGAGGCSAEATRINYTTRSCLTPCVVGTVFENQGGAPRRRRCVCICASLPCFLFLIVWIRNGVFLTEKFERVGRHECESLL